MKADPGTRFDDVEVRRHPVKADEKVYVQTSDGERLST
jgi:hypothetical protein